MSILRQIVSEMLAGYTQKTTYKPFEFFLARPKKNLEGFVWSFLSIASAVNDLLIQTNRTALQTCKAEE